MRVPPRQAGAASKVVGHPACFHTELGKVLIRSACKPCASSGCSAAYTSRCCCSRGNPSNRSDTTYTATCDASEPLPCMLLSFTICRCVGCKCACKSCSMCVSMDLTANTCYHRGSRVQAEKNMNPRSILTGLAVLTCVGVWVRDGLRSPTELHQAPRQDCAVLLEKAGEGVICAAPDHARGGGRGLAPPLDPARRHALGILIDLERARLEELVLLPKIGPAMAERILQGRPYHRCTDLLSVPGLGPATFARIQGWFTLCNSSAYSE